MAGAGERAAGTNAERFGVCLAEAGYTPSSAANQVLVLAHLSRWLEERGLVPEDLTDGGGGSSGCAP